MGQFQRCHRITVSLDFEILRMLKSHMSLITGGLQFKARLLKRPEINSDVSLAGTCKHYSQSSGNIQRCNMAVHYRKFTDEILTFIFVNTHVLLDTTSDKKIKISFLSESYLIIKSYTVVYGWLLMLISFFVLIVLTHFC